MSTFLAKIKYLGRNVPAPLRTAVEHVATIAAATFVATAKPLLPALVATPSMSLTKAALTTAAAAALVAAYHAAKGSAKGVAAKWATIPVETSKTPAA